MEVGSYSSSPARSLETPSPLSTSTPHSENQNSLSSFNTNIRWLIKPDHLRNLGSLISYQTEGSAYTDHQSFHDCIINIHENKWYVHRVFISMESLFFRKFFLEAEQTSDNKMEVYINFPDIKCEVAFGRVLQYMYAGKLAIKKAVEMIPLLVVANKLQMNILSDLLVKSLPQFCEKGNIIDVLQTINEYNKNNQYDNLNDICMELIAKDFANIFANNAELDQKLSNFNLQNIIQILKHKKLVATHRQISNFAHYYIRKNDTTNNSIFTKLIPFVKKIASEDCLFFLSRAYETNNLDEQHRCIEYLAPSFSKLSIADLNEIPMSIIIKLFDDDNLAITSEDEVYSAIQSLITTRNNLTQDDVTSLWGTLRFRYLGIDSLSKAKGIGCPLEFWSEGIFHALIDSKMPPPSNEARNLPRRLCMRNSLKKLENQRQFVDINPNYANMSIHSSFSHSPKYNFEILNSFEKKNRFDNLNNNINNNGNNNISGSYEKGIEKRKEENGVNCQYTAEFDRNGVIYFIGSDSRRGTYENPYSTGKINIVCSTTTEEGDISAITSRKDSIFFTSNVPNSFISIDLKHWAVQPVYYSLKHGYPNGSYSLRDWSLDASLDGFTWVNLILHVDCQDLNAGYKTVTWTLKKTESYFRYYRIKILKPNSTFNHSICLSGFELYGRIVPLESISNS